MSMHFPPTCAPYETVTNILGDSSSGNRPVILAKRILANFSSVKLSVSNPWPTVPKATIFTSNSWQVFHISSAGKKKGVETCRPVVRVFYLLYTRRDWQFFQLWSLHPPKNWGVGRCFIQLKCSEILKTKPHITKLYITKEYPALQHSTLLSCSSGLLKHNKLNITWLAAIRRPCLAASAQARRTCAALQFEMPISLITPAFGSITCTANPKFQG